MSPRCYKTPNYVSTVYNDKKTIDKETRLLTAILCTTPNLVFSDLESTYDNQLYKDIEVQAANGEVMAWLNSQEACQVLQLG